MVFVSIGFLLHRPICQFAFLTILVSIRKPRMSHWQFSIRKGGIFRPGKEIEGLRGGVPVYRLAERRDPACATAEGSGHVGWRSHRPRAEKDPFRTETILIQEA